MKEKFFDNFLALKRRIAAACERAKRDPKEVVLLAVSKGAPLEAIETAVGSGVRDFGESRVQEAAQKIARAPEGLNWHLIGHLQSNKAAKALELGFKTIQSVDSVELAGRFNGLLKAKGRAQSIFLELNIAREPQKNGFWPEHLIESARTIKELEHLKLEGLMCMGPRLVDQGGIRPYFKRAKDLCAGLEDLMGGKLILSMGMSQDFEVAVEEGATMVRVGSALFAPYIDQ